MSKKSVAVYFDEPGAYGYPLDKPRYLEAYIELSRLIEKLGSKLVIVREFSTYLGGGKFSTSWRINPEGEVVENGEVKVSVVYDKGDRDTFKAEDVRVINTRYINEVCADKVRTYELFGDYSPESFTAYNLDEVKEYVDKVKTKKVVIKPVAGYEGRGVQVVEKSDVIEVDEEHFPSLVQSYIDSSGGISGLTRGAHDFRMVIINGDIVNCSIRTPAEGSYLANVAQGGETIFVPVESIPSEARDIAKVVDKHFEPYGDRIYSVDLMFEDDKPILLELNSRSALARQFRGQEAIDFQYRLADILLRSQ